MNDYPLMLSEPVPPASVGQALLFSPEIEIEIEKEERQGRYTLERFKRMRPAAHRDCITALAASKPGYEGLRRIAAIIGVHHLTVAAVRDEEGETIDTLRDRLSRKALSAAELLMDRILEHPGTIPVGMLGMTVDGLIKTGELLGNRATHRVEKTERIDIYAEYEQIKEKFLEPGDVREIEDVGAETGLSGGNVLPIAAPAENADIDAESTDSDPGAKERRTTDPTLPTTDQPNETAAEPSISLEEGGRGSEVLPGGGLSRSGYNKRNFSGNGPSFSPPAI